MKKILSTRTAVIAIISLILLTTIMLGSNWWAKKNNTAPIYQAVVNDVSGLVARIVNAPINIVGASANSLTGLLRTFEENQKLKANIDKLAQDEVKLKTVIDENKALKKQLELKATLTDYTTVGAVVIGRSPTTWQTQLVINQGTQAGIKKGMPVMAGQGVIGRISEVSTTNAKVALISDMTPTADRYAVTVDGKGGQVNGIITGFNPEKNQLTMGQVTSDNEIKPGDLVKTSGLGGIIPKGLYIGKVIDVTKDDYGASKQINIEPAADLSNIPTVIVAISNLSEDH